MLIQKSGFSEILARYTDGIDHVIDRRSSLSGGERQRLVLFALNLFV